jgi:5-methylcytosine-specific restriction endonuclease McrA
MNEMGRGLSECVQLNDADLIRETRFLAERARHNEIRLLAHLAEFDARRLCLEEGFRSLYEYCTISLGFEEGEAYRRIRVARVIRGFPEAKKALEDRRVTASHLVVLSPWLERGNIVEWLGIAEKKTRRELEALVAARYPQAPQPDAVRNLPMHPFVVPASPPMALEVPPPSETDAALAQAAAPSIESSLVPMPSAASWQILTPVSAGRVRVGFDAASAVGQLLERMRQVLRHKYPEGRLEDLVREAVEAYLDRKDPQRRMELKAAKAECAGAPATGPEIEERLPTRFLRAWAAGRYIPAKVKSAVWARDEGRCAWREPDGTVCGSKDWIEYDHLRPYAKGGKSDDARNIRLLCRVHNQAAAEAAFGPRGSEPGFGFRAAAP